MTDSCYAPSSRSPPPPAAAAAAAACDVSLCRCCSSDDLDFADDTPADTGAATGGSTDTAGPADAAGARPASSDDRGEPC